MSCLFVDNLTVIDCSFLDPGRGVVGESWIVDIELTGALDEQGMVFDFGHVKKRIKQHIDARADHRLLVPTAYAGCRTSSDSRRLTVEFELQSGGVILHESPEDAVMLVAAEKIDAEDLGRELQQQLQGIMPRNVTGVRLRLRTEESGGPYYHYTHGLQQHEGQCQRIAHGHRSRIEIEVDEVRSSAHEEQWASRLKDAYVATDHHIVGEFEHNGIAHTRMAYRAAQGEFAMSLPSDHVYVLPNASTVEHIAEHIATTVAREAAAPVLVRAYEGVGKGALGVASGPT